MDGKSVKLLYIVFTLSLHLKSALGFISGVGDGNMGCIERERQALLEFKKGLIDDYNRLSSWGSEDAKKNCCSWEGVQCSKQTGHVLKLDLQAWENPRLRGKISPSLIELHHLSYLSLSSNDFNQSKIPDFICSLSNLKHLDLDYANLTGPIPSHLGNLTRLQYLDLSMNDLNIVENLEWLSHLVSIQYLDLTFLNLSVANDWLKVVSCLPKLSVLKLYYCDLPLITPSSLSHINSTKSLTYLDLASNFITSSIFPWLLNSSTNLNYLDLSANQLQGSIPNAFDNMNSLEQLFLNENQFEGGIPKSFGYICTLRILDLAMNNLNGQVLEFLHNLQGCEKDSLEELILDGNQFTGKLFPFNNKLNQTLGKRVESLQKLEILGVHSNMLGGVISETQLSNFPKLQYLDLSHNSFTLNISFDWVPPFELNFLYLRSCKLGPDFPNWIKTQRFIWYLDLSNTGISDTIPTWFWDLPFELEYLNLSHNQIKGKPLPVISSNLTTLNLSKNKFSGLNSFICSFTGNIIHLDLSSNHLSEGIPNCFMHWEELEILNFAHNNLFGEIPLSMGSLIQLVALDLSNNNLSGEFPWSLQNCTMLRFMQLEKNNLSGKIPAWIGERMSSLIILSLRSNKFHGSLRLQICLLVHIQLLDLSDNNISGTIPRCLNKLTTMVHKVSISLIYESHLYMFWDGTEFHLLGSAMSNADNSVNTIVGWKGNVYEYGKNFGEMRSIDLANNKLTGEIPEEISALVELKSLNLSRNMLTGRIPTNFGQLEQLESLDLSRNQFFGSIPASMADLHYLSYLDLSYNKFSGKIPTGTQLQSFDPLRFIGNRGLCGPPLIEKCPGDVTSNTTTNGVSKIYQEKGGEFWKCLYAGMGLGFIVGFWGVCGSLILNRSWRHAYFLLVINLKDWLYVTIVVHTTRLQKMFHS
ncbi:receptor-like protein EIX2 [Fagus crenata]